MSDDQITIPPVWSDEKQINPICPKCRGSGWYAYDENHGKPCELCCSHDQGWWPLTELHGKPGHWACLSGCGETRSDNPEDIDHAH
jgi:hypothetical protein